MISATAGKVLNSGLVVLVVPPNLKDQWEKAIRKFLIPGSFDVIHYAIGPKKEGFLKVLNSSHQPQYRKIILVTNSVRIYFKTTGAT